MNNTLYLELVLPRFFINHLSSVDYSWLNLRTTWFVAWIKISSMLFALHNQIANILGVKSKINIVTNYIA